jgi:hypothetical protein
LTEKEGEPMAKQMKANKEEAWDMTEKDKFEVAGKIAAILIGACPTIGDAIAVVGSLLIDLVSEANEWDDDQRADFRTRLAGVIGDGVLR